MGQPAVVVAGPLGAAEHHRLARAGGAHRFDQFGHPRRAIDADALVVDLAAVLPAPPPHPVRLVVEVEDDAVVALVFGRDRPPEVRRVVGVGHRDDPGRLVVARRRVVEVEDHDEPRRLEPRDEATDSVPVVDAAVARLDPVDPQPAGLVQRQRHRVDVPGLHCRDRAGVARPVEEPVALLAGVLGAGAVHAQQAHRLPGLVDEVVALDADPRLGRRRSRRDEQDRREGEEERSPQTATRSGTRTRREKVIAPSSSDP
jgi:hypothetical protein